MTVIDELRRCYKCGLETDEARGDCPKCGVRLLSPKQVRGRGWGLLFVGLFLLIFMGTITINIAPRMLHPGDPDAGGSTFTGTMGQSQLFFVLSGLMIVLGLTGMVAGRYQIKKGRQNKGLMYFSLGLVVLIALTGKLILS